MQNRRFMLLAALLVALVAVMVPTSAQAQCGDCEEWTGGPGWECNGATNRPNEPPYCDGTWILHIACSTCGIEEEEEDQQLAAVTNESGVMVVSGVTLPNTFPAPTGCEIGRIGRVYSALAASGVDPFLEVLAMPEATAADATQ